MPTFNQLVHSGRQASESKHKTPALLKGWNSIKREQIDKNSPQKRGVCTTVSRRSRTQPSEKWRESGFQTE